MKEAKDEDGDQFVLCLDRLPSRNSSMSCSSRLYYRSSEGVPFQWEMLPGTPKNDNIDDIIPPHEAVVPPPISPPPAALGRGLPKPFFVGRRPSRYPLFGSWRKQSNSKAKKYSSLDKSFDQRFRSCGSDGCDFMESPTKTTSSSSSFSSSSFSSSSISKDPPLPAAESSGRWQPGCGPWSINTIKIAIGRRL